METLVMVGMGAIGIFFILFIIFFITGTSQKGLEKTLTKNMNAVIKAQNDIIKNNENILRENANKTADINKDAVKTIVHSAKEGLTDDSIIYCKHCGSLIDGDSKFCKNCGREQ